PFHVALGRRQSEALITQLEPDVVFVIGWYWLISDATLAVAPRGFIGIHNSLLPKYRGGSPLVWTLINGESETGFSLFSLGRGTDDGPIWAQGRVPVGADDTIGEVLDRLESLAVDTLRGRMDAIVTGTAAPEPQREDGATWCCQRRPEDGEIDWSEPAARIHDFIRAQSRPYPGAFTWLGPDRMTIWRAQLLDITCYGTPGRVARIDADGVRVACGDGRCLLLREVELADGARPAQDVIRSIHARFPRRAGSRTDA